MQYKQNEFKIMVYCYERILFANLVELSAFGWLIYDIDYKKNRVKIKKN